jgi:hypothetical protein
MTVNNMIIVIIIIIITTDYLALLYPQNVGTSPTRGSRSVGIVRSRTQATEFLLLVVLLLLFEVRPLLWGIIVIIFSVLK